MKLMLVLIFMLHELSFSQHNDRWQEERERSKREIPAEEY